TYMRDLVAGKYRLPWEDEIKVKDGTSCGFDKPMRRYGEPLKPAAE
ncbi:formamidase, partial [Rhizobium leguminosarum]